MLDGRIAIAAIAWLLLAKPFATAASVGSGNPGGVFTPTLMLGACTGALYAAGLHAMFGARSPTSAAYVIVGLAAALAATTHAPVMAAVLACECSGRLGARAAAPARGCAIAAAPRTPALHRLGLHGGAHAAGVRWRLTLDGRRVVEDKSQATDAYVQPGIARPQRRV